MRACTRCAARRISPGPISILPSLTYQSWHEARFGKENWQKLDLIPRKLWAEYLLWFRRVVGLPVRNGCELLEIAPAADGLLAATVARDGATEIALRAQDRAGDRPGSDGQLGDPGAVAPSAGRRWWRARPTPIDFDALRGKTVAVIGAGATAFDNAATALEAGAAEVHLLCRRAEIQVIQPYRWLTFRGFLRHFCDLDDAWRWRFMRAILELREGFPQATYDRCARFANFHLHEGSPVEAAHEIGDGDRIADAARRIVGGFCHLRRRHRDRFRRAPRIEEFRRQHRDLGRSLSAAGRRTAARGSAAILILPTTTRSPSA